MSSQTPTTRSIVLAIITTSIIKPSEPALALK